MLTLVEALAERRVRVNALHPGPVDTRWAVGQLHEDIRQRIPSGRWTTPEEIAAVVRWLLSEEPWIVTWQVINTGADSGVMKGTSDIGGVTAAAGIGHRSAMDPTQHPHRAAAARALLFAVVLWAIRGVSTDDEFSLRSFLVVLAVSVVVMLPIYWFSNRAR